MLNKVIFISLLVFSFHFTIYAQSIEDKVRQKIINIVTSLREENTLHLGYAVGFSGIPETNNKYFKLYQRLKLEATDLELNLLANDKSTMILLYSFLILQSRNYGGVKSIFLNHLKGQCCQKWLVKSSEIY
jgi:hypothetical protein